MEGAGEPPNAVHIHSVKLVSFSVGDRTSVVMCPKISEGVSIASLKSAINL